MHPIMPMPSLPTELGEALASGRLTVVLGDALDRGDSSARRRLACALSDAAELPEPDLWTAATLLEQHHGRVALIDRVIESVCHHAPSRELYILLAGLPIQTIVSLHPDPFLEVVLTGCAEPFEPQASDLELALLPLDSSSRRLYLLGGSSQRGEGLVLTHRDLQRQLTRLERLARGLRERLDGPLLLLHMSADPAWPALLIQALRHRGGRTSPIFLVDQDLAQASTPAPFRVLPYSPSRVLEALAALPLNTTTVPVLPETPTVPLRRTPFRFLNYFEAEDAEFFFGRTVDTDQVCGELKASPSRITVLCGRSGVGKTSLIKAAVLPFLEQTGRFITAYARLTVHPEHALLQALADRLGLTAPPDLGLVEGFEWLFTQHPVEQVIVIDQGEEAFFMLGNAVLESFFASLSACASRYGSTTRFLLVVREDFLGRFSALTRVVPGLLSSVHRLQELSREAAAEAIRQPARLCDVPIEEALIEAMLDDLSPDTILPAQLQIVCEQLYRVHGDAPCLRLSDYRSLGGAAQILRNYLEQAVALLPEPLEKLARELLKALVTSEQTRALLCVEKLSRRLHVPHQEVTELLHTLIHVHRLVREVPGAPVCYELAHESMAPSITAWLDELEARLRAVQEILDQEVSNARRFEGITVPPDRLHLIDEHRDQLDLTPEAIRVVLGGFLLRGELPRYWIDRALDAGPEASLTLWQSLVFEPVIRGAEALKETLTAHHTLIERLPSVAFPKAVLEQLIGHLLRLAGVHRVQVLRLVDRDSSGSLWSQLVSQYRNRPPTELLELVLSADLPYEKVKPLLDAQPALPSTVLLLLLSARLSQEPGVLAQLLERTADTRFLTLMVMRLGLLIRLNRLKTSDWKALSEALMALLLRQSPMAPVLLQLILEFAGPEESRVLLSSEQGPRRMYALVAILTPGLQKTLSKAHPGLWKAFCETLVKQPFAVVEKNPERERIVLWLLSCSPFLSTLGKARLCQLLAASGRLTPPLAKRLNPEGPKQLRALISTPDFEPQDLELVEHSINASGGLTVLPTLLRKQLTGFLQTHLLRGGPPAFRAARMLAAHPDPQVVLALLSGSALVLKGALAGLTAASSVPTESLLLRLKALIPTLQPDPLAVMSVAQLLVRGQNKAGLRLAADVVVRSSRPGLALAWQQVLGEVQDEACVEVLISLLGTRFSELSSSILDELKRRELPGLRQSPALHTRLVESFKILRPQESRKLREVLVHLLPESMESIVQGAADPISAISYPCQALLARSQRPWIYVRSDA